MIAPGTGSYSAGQSFTITPNANYQIASITVNGNPVTVNTPAGQTYTFTTLTAPATITATYSAVVTQYTVTVTQTANGVIAPVTSSYNAGATPSFTITPNSGYQIASITANGASVTVTASAGSSQAYQFAALSGDCTLTATYSARTFGIDSSGSNSATSGTTVTVSGLNCAPGDVIIVLARTHGGSSPVTVSSIATSPTPSLSFTTRGSISGVSSVAYITERYAVNTGVTAVTSVTVTFSGTLSSSETAAVVVYSISGANTATPFDTHAGLPYSASSSSASTPTVTGVSTTNANILLIGLEGSRTTTPATVGTMAGTTGTLLKTQVAGTDGSAATEYRTLTSAITSQSVAFGSSQTGWAMIVDAVQRAW